MSGPMTAAGRELVARRDFHEPSCPRWFAISQDDAPCTCSLGESVLRVEREASTAPRPDPLSAPWEACKVCGGDHWTKDHPE